MAAATRAFLDEAQTLARTQPEQAIALEDRVRAGLEQVPIAYDLRAAKALHQKAGAALRDDDGKLR